MNIFLNSKIVTDNKLSSDAIVVYTALRMIQNSNINEYYVNMKLLAYQLSNNLMFSRKYMERLSDGLKELIIKKYITISANNADKDYILDIGNLIIENRSDENKVENFFVVIKPEEIHKIMNLDSRLDKFSILRYFMCMLSTINHNATYYDVMGNIFNNFVGFMTNDYIGSLCGVTSYTTYDKYNHLLEENELIYIFRHSVLIRDEKGQLKNLPNHYGRYKDKELIIGYAVNRENFELGEDTIDKRANESRSLMQKYYCMVKYGTEYSEKEIRRIYRYVHYRNQQNEKNYKQAVEKGYSGDEFLDKIVSEEIFYKYEYLFVKDSSVSGTANTGSVVSDNDNWGEPVSMEHDFTIEEMFDMPVMEDESNEQNSVLDNESHDNNNHGVFCVTGRDSDYIDIDDLY